MTKRQIRISDKHFKELDDLCSKLGLKKSEIMGLALSVLKSLSDNKAKGLKIETETGEIKLLLPIDITR